MSRAATRKITKLRIGEVSLVGDGDNPHADVLILKHRNITGADLSVTRQLLDEVRKDATEYAQELSEGGFEMNIDELTGKLDGIEKALEAAQTKNTALEAQVTEVTKARDEALAEVEKAKKVPAALAAAAADDDANDGDPEDKIMKSLPKAVRDLVEKARTEASEAKEEVAKARDEREEEAEIAKVRETGIEGADDYGKLIHRVRKGRADAADADKLLDLIAKAKAVGDAGAVLFTKIGKHVGGNVTGDSADAQAKLDEAVSNIQKAKPGVTREQAYMEAIDANPALYDAVAKIKPANA